MPVLGSLCFIREAATSEYSLDRLVANTPRSSVFRGWHFGYMGSSKESDVSKRIGDKVVAAAHQEYNNQDVLAEARDRILLGQDMFGRNAKFVRVEIDDSYPDYLLRHLDDYQHLIMTPISRYRRMVINVTMKTKRFFRKAIRKIKRSFGRKA